MTVHDLVTQTLDNTAHEEIIFALSRSDLAENKTARLMRIALTALILEGAKVENVHFTDAALTLVFSKDNHVYQLDWQDGFGLTLAEMFPAVAGNENLRGNAQENDEVTF